MASEIPADNRRYVSCCSVAVSRRLRAFHLAIGWQIGTMAIWRLKLNRNWRWPFFLVVVFGCVVLMSPRCTESTCTISFMQPQLPPPHVRRRSALAVATPMGTRTTSISARCPAQSQKRCANVQFAYAIARCESVRWWKNGGTEKHRHVDPLGFSVLFCHCLSLSLSLSLSSLSPALCRSAYLSLSLCGVCVCTCL